MANELQRFYCNKNKGINGVTEDTVNNGTNASGDVNLDVVRASSLTKVEVIDAIEYIKEKIATSAWPPSVI